MPGRYSHTGKLSPNQREAARLELTGIPATEIAARVGVQPTTISAWRNRADYQAHLDALMRDADRDTLRSARRVREDALKVARGALVKAGSMLGRTGDDALSAHEVAAVGRMALEVYKTTAAQTGVNETTRQEVAVGASVGIQAIRAALSIGEDPDDIEAALEDGGSD